MSSQPNVVLMISHDTGRFISPYGYDMLDTPNFERLKSESTMFSRAFCNAPLCSPARAAALTGQPPHQNGMMGLPYTLLGDWDMNAEGKQRHLARIFRNNGYRTVLCGFEHETQNFLSVGFEEGIHGRGSGLNEGLTLKGIGRSITDWLESRSGNEPFYMQIGSKETHREWSLYSKPYKGKGCWKAPYLIDSTDVDREMAEMQGAVRALDMGLGEVRDAFDSAGLEDDTIFIITSDHGIEVPPKTDGITVLPLLTGKGEYHPRNALFFEKTYHDNYDPIRGLRTERYKYVMNFDAQKLYDVRIATAPRYNWFRQSINKYTAEELYDLESDANEEKIWRKIRNTGIFFWNCENAWPTG